MRNHWWVVATRGGNRGEHVAFKKEGFHDFGGCVFLYALFLFLVAWYFLELRITASIPIEYLLVGPLHMDELDMMNRTLATPLLPELPIISGDRYVVVSTLLLSLFERTTTLSNKSNQTRTQTQFKQHHIFVSPNRWLDQNTDNDNEAYQRCSARLSQ